MPELTSTNPAVFTQSIRIYFCLMPRRQNYRNSVFEFQGEVENYSMRTERWVYERQLPWGKKKIIINVIYISVECRKIINCTIKTHVESDGWVRREKILPNESGALSYALSEKVSSPSTLVSSSVLDDPAWPYGGVMDEPATSLSGTTLPVRWIVFTWWTQSCLYVNNFAQILHWNLAPSCVFAWRSILRLAVKTFSQPATVHLNIFLFDILTKTKIRDDKN